MVESRATLAEQAYVELGNRIFSGSFPPGERLLVDQLSASLSLSPTPVKEALAMLERDGLVEGVARRAQTVRRFTADDIRNIYEARTLFESQSVRTGILSNVVSADVINELRDLYTKQMSFASRKTPKALQEVLRLDRKFHELLVGLGKNKLICAWHQVLLRQVQTIRAYSLDTYNVERAKTEHAAIIDALANSNVDVAIGVLDRHLSLSRDEFLARPPDALPERQGSKKAKGDSPYKPKVDMPRGS